MNLEYIIAKISFKKYYGYNMDINNNNEKKIVYMAFFFPQYHICKENTIQLKENNILC